MPISRPGLPHRQGGALHGDVKSPLKMLYAKSLGVKIPENLIYRDFM
jgi:hypothetical protein